MPEISEQRLFLPAKDYQRSVDFYRRLGWATLYEAHDLTLMSLGASKFFVQNAWVEDWAHNTMVHLVVDDAAAWYGTVKRVQIEGGFTEVKVKAPQREAYGALATHVIDPAGVLLFFAQMDKG